MADEVYAEPQIEEVEGIVQCNACGFWGKMPGYINQMDNKIINFVCPECNALEQVKNPEAN